MSNEAYDLLFDGYDLTNVSWLPTKTKAQLEADLEHIQHLYQCTLEMMEEEPSQYEVEKLTTLESRTSEIKTELSIIRIIEKLNQA